LFDNNWHIGLAPLLYTAIHVVGYRPTQWAVHWTWKESSKSDRPTDNIQWLCTSGFVFI